MKMFDLLIFFSFLNLAFHAQQKYAFSVKDAVEYALSHHPMVLVTEKDVRLSHLKTQEFTGIGFPQISVGAGIQHFVKLPVSILPNFVAPAVYGGLVSAGVAPYDPQKLSADGYAPIEAQFGQKYQASASFTASQLVFSSDYLIGLQASKSYEEISKLSYHQLRQQTKYEIMKLYFEHQNNVKRLELLDAQLERIKRLHKEMIALNNQGFAEKLDVQRMELAQDQLITEKEKIQALLQISLLRLKFQMGYPLSDTLVLTDSISDFTSPILSVPPGATKRYDFQILQRANQLQNLNKKRHLYGHLPSLVLFASGGYQAFNQELDFWSRNVKWFPNLMIGASLQWNLFDGLQKVKRYEQSKIEIEKIKIQSSMLEDASRLEQISQQTLWVNAYKMLQVKSRNYELAAEVLNIAEKKYKQGVGSIIEILQAISALKEARVQYLDVIYDCKMAELNYKKATGEL